MAILVLSAGRDAVLLKTRDEVLSSLGCIVTPVTSSADLVNQFFDGDHDMVVLCHSIPSDERKRILRMIRVYRPSLRTLLIANLNDGYGPLDIPEFGIRIPPEPEALVKAVQSIFPQASSPA